jgi:hypothetical protein
MDHGQSGETDDEGIERDSAECEEILRTNFATFDDVLEVNYIYIKVFIKILLLNNKRKNITYKLCNISLFLFILGMQ